MIGYYLNLSFGRFKTRIYCKFLIPNEKNVIMFSIVKIFQKNETLRHLNQLKIHIYINQNGR